MSSPRLYMRVGDQLPSISCQILNMDGNVVNLPAGTTASILIRPKWNGGRTMRFQADPVNDVIAYDWQYEEALVLEPGVYDFAVRCHLPSGTFLVAPTDHHAELVVGSAAIWPGHYLDPRVGHVYTTLEHQMPEQFVLKAKAAGPDTDDMHTIAAVWHPSPDHSWQLQFNGENRRVRFRMSLDGTAGGGNVVFSLLPAIPATEGPFEIALVFNSAPGAFTRTHLWYRLSGQAWVVGDMQEWAPHEPMWWGHDLVIGGLAADEELWQGQIWYVECRVGLDPTAGNVRWRFEANDGFPSTSAGETTWTDRRDKLWTVTDADAIE